MGKNDCRNGSTVLIRRKKGGFPTIIRSPNLQLLPEEGLRFYSQIHLQWRYLGFDCVSETAVHLCFVWDMCPGWNVSHRTEKTKETRYR